MIRSWHLEKEKAAGSERKSGGSGRRTGKLWHPLNASILREHKFLKGSGDGKSGWRS